MINQSVMKCAVSVIIPTYDRVEILLHTLTRIMDCYPIPDEIIVHVDGGDQTSEQIIQKHFPEIKGTIFRNCRQHFQKINAYFLEINRRHPMTTSIFKQF